MSADLYSEHFGFQERPFSLSPDPEMLFWTKQHTRAFTILEYGLVTKAPLTVVTGEVGTGKTTLLQAMLRRIEDDVVVGLISNAQGSRDDLLRWVLNSLNVEHTGIDTYVVLFQLFQDFVIETYASGRRVILIIDEAQNLGTETLEELRMLTNINSGKDELLQLILIGQPELRELIERPELRQFAQRVTSTYHLKPLNASTTVDYIVHRLQTVGGTGEEFTEEAMRAVIGEARGIPRMVNKICDLALVYAASDGKPAVDGETINELIEDGIIMKPHEATLYLTQEVQFKRAAE